MNWKSFRILFKAITIPLASQIQILRRSFFLHPLRLYIIVSEPGFIQYFWFFDISEHILDISENIFSLHASEVYRLAPSPDFSFFGIKNLMNSDISRVVTDESIVPHKIDYIGFMILTGLLRTSQWRETTITHPRAPDTPPSRSPFDSIFLWKICNFSIFF